MIKIKTHRWRCLIFSFIPSILLALMVGLFTQSTLAQALEAPKFKQGRWLIYNTHRYFSTSENFDSNYGDRVELNAGNELKYHHNLTTVHYGLSKNIDLFGGFRFASVSTVTGDVARSNTGFSDLVFGGNYQWMKGRYSLVPGLDLNIPLFSIKTDTDDAFFNEGALEARAKLYADYKWRILDVYGQLALSLLSDGRGGRGYFNLGLRKRVSRFLFLTEISGMSTLINDSLTDEATTRSAVTDRVQGGSLAFYSINPGVMSLILQAEMQVHPSTVVGLGFSKDFTGTRYSSGYALNSFLRIDPMKIYQKFSSAKSKKRKNPGDDFIPDERDGDLKYFDANPTQPKKTKKVKKN